MKTKLFHFTIDKENLFAFFLRDCNDSAEYGHDIVSQ